MSKIKQIIIKSLRVWERAEPKLRRKARKLYEQTWEIIEKNPEVAAKTVNVLLGIYQLAVEEKYVEAFGWLCLLTVTLLLRPHKRKK